MVGLSQDNFLIVATYDSLYQLSLDSESWERILLDTRARIRSAAFDPVEKKVYWSGTENVIRRVNLDGTGEEIIHTVGKLKFSILYNSHFPTQQMSAYLTRSQDHNTQQLFYDIHVLGISYSYTHLITFHSTHTQTHTRTHTLASIYNHTVSVGVTPP